MYKPRAFKRQFAVANDGREKTIDSSGSREGAREARSPPPAPLFLDQTEARIVKGGALRDIQKTAARDTKARRAEKKFFGDQPPPHVSQGLDLALIENEGKQIHMPNQKGKQSSKGGPMVRTFASHNCGIRIPKSRQYVG